ncbi:MAG: Ig-like domain-containing protein [Nitrososphaerota archaeon]
MATRTITISPSRSQAYVGETIAVSGNVSEDGRPVGQAMVEVFVDGAREASTTTDSGGRYSVGVALRQAGSRTIEARSGTASARTTVTAVSRPTGRVDVTISLSQGSILAGQQVTISGRVTRDGAPVTEGSGSVHIIDVMAGQPARSPMTAFLTPAGTYAVVWTFTTPKTYSIYAEFFGVRSPAATLVVKPVGGSQAAPLTIPSSTDRILGSQPPSGIGGPPPAPITEDEIRRLREWARQIADAVRREAAEKLTTMVNRAKQIADELKRSVGGSVLDYWGICEGDNCIRVYPRGRVVSVAALVARIYPGANYVCYKRGESMQLQTVTEVDRLVSSMEESARSHGVALSMRQEYYYQAVINPVESEARRGRRMTESEVRDLAWKAMNEWSSYKRIHDDIRDALSRIESAANWFKPKLRRVTREVYYTRVADLFSELCGIGPPTVSPRQEETLRQRTTTETPTPKTTDIEAEQLRKTKEDVRARLADARGRLEQLRREEPNLLQELERLRSERLNLESLIGQARSELQSLIQMLETGGGAALTEGQIRSQIEAVRSEIETLRITLQQAIFERDTLLRGVAR